MHPYRILITLQYEVDRQINELLHLKLIKPSESEWVHPIVCPALNILQSLSLVLQTASALAVAECAFGFEHRDLHLGNWLIRRTEKNWLYYSTRHWRWSLPTFGVQAFLIDFTMSRIQVDGNVYAMDLSYLSESEQQGDCNLLNHNNIYGMMKEALREDFTAFKPLTNLWWLAHLTCNVHSMQRELSLENPEMDEFSRIALYALEKLKNNILLYSNTMEFLRAEVFNVHPNNNLIGEGWNGPQLLLQPH
ncbi:hypothetical protein TNIN_220421 [Trichonephila inaurata madagascariensis]|uniref:Uncharacterized protein n=1 Tax=Trichonephila inaurata madagascariensis TaxID=2747483 RepID=A0A8X6Y9N1_9ARAC|nr:hypothetical protein TNIN_220421 [Trichonephila inaurata madagascariensis]